VGGPGTPHSISFVKTLHPVVRPGVECRSSVGWFDSSLSRRRFQAVPFVCKSGKLSLHTLFVWKAYPEQVIFSLISTVYFRLLSILRKRFGFNLRSRLMNCAFKISIAYVLTRHNWLIDRFLGMSRKGSSIKTIEKHVHFCVCELDENKRFVYSQAYFQANWLKFQVFRPRDKSSEKVRIGTHLKNLGFEDRSLLDDNDRIAYAFNRLSNLWEVDAYLPSYAGAHHSVRSGSESAFSLSELARSNWFPEENFSFSSDDEIDW